MKTLKKVTDILIDEFNENNEYKFMSYISYFENYANKYVQLILLNENKPIGTIRISIFNGKKQFFDSLYISKKYRDKGLGKMILRFSENILKEYRSENVILYSKNDWHRNWYISQGYIVSGITCDKYMIMKKYFK